MSINKLKKPPFWPVSYTKGRFERGNPVAFSTEKKKNRKKNPFKERKERKAERKHKQLNYRYSPKRSEEIMERMKVVMEINSKEKHPKN